MEDEKIIELYWSRDELALRETDRKYGGYCRTIANNILHDLQDADECVSDTWLGAWNAMPPKRPSFLSAFLGRITRNLALDRWKATHADKRGGGALPAALDELSECVPSGVSVETELDGKELARAIDAFLRTLPERECTLFLRRYWFADSLRDAAARLGLSESNAKSILFRTREKLRKHLEKEGIAV